MTNGNLSRRKLLERGIQLPLGGALLAAGVAGTANAADKVCVDLKSIDAGQKSIRESLNYMEMGKDPTMVCGKCSFFTDPAAGCGMCMIFGGPANEHGHCDSWAAKG